MDSWSWLRAFVVAILLHLEAGAVFCLYLAIVAAAAGPSVPWNVAMPIASAGTVLSVGAYVAGLATMSVVVRPRPAPVGEQPAGGER